MSPPFHMSSLPLLGLLPWHLGQPLYLRSMVVGLKKDVARANSVYLSLSCEMTRIYSYLCPCPEPVVEDIVTFSAGGMVPGEGHDYRGHGRIYSRTYRFCSETLSPSSK